MFGHIKDDPSLMFATPHAHLQDAQQALVKSKAGTKPIKKEPGSPSVTCLLIYVYSICLY